MKTFKFNKLERGGRRSLMVDLLSDDGLTGITFGACSSSPGDWCQVWTKNGLLWEKNFGVPLVRRDSLTGLKLLIAACLPELMMMGYMPIGSFEYGNETVQLNPHDDPSEAVLLPPEFQALGAG